MMERGVVCRGCLSVPSTSPRAYPPFRNSVALGSGSEPRSRTGCRRVSNYGHNGSLQRSQLQSRPVISRFSSRRTKNCALLEPPAGGAKAKARLATAARADDAGEVAEFFPEDLELLYPIGQFSLQEVAELGRPSNSSLYADGGTDSAPAPQPRAQVNVYAARLTSRVPSESGGGRVVLKEYPPAARDLVSNELRVYRRLRETQGWHAETAWEDDCPILSLLGKLEAPGAPGESAALLPGNSEGKAATWPIQLPDAPVLPPSQLSIWLVFRWEALNAAVRFPQTPQSANSSLISLLSPFQVPEHQLQRRKTFLKRVMRGGMEALAWCHARGVIHGGLSSSCLILSTFDERQADYLKVKLASFGLGEDLSMGVENVDPGTVSLCRQLGASSPMDIAAMLRKLDIYHMALAFLELVFSSLCSQGPTAKNSAAALRRIWEEVYEMDMAAIREYTAADADWTDVVTFFNEDEAAGWAFFESALNFSKVEAESLASSRFLLM